MFKCVLLYSVILFAFPFKVKTICINVEVETDFCQEIQLIHTNEHVLTNTVKVNLMLRNMLRLDFNSNQKK